MTGDRETAPAQQHLTDDQQDRWHSVLDHLADALPDADAWVVVDGTDGGAALLGDRLRAAGRHCVRLAGCAPTWVGRHAASTQRSVPRSMASAIAR
ncbi:hypothetical protein [Micromonospora sp. CB01531]|uniref:hypothetical protein n=1 Tax=Micromonospora sp. CB01531 TaxID=1718947 RepID=UPI00093F2BBB|nr:hypothetical protein [Micromonospora sp. CB01531]OKI62303.1 hypothetical protein A6A27_04720 [Micromonospora sp. CB01531]